MLSREGYEMHGKIQKYFGSFFQKRTFFLRLPFLLPRH
jgi:hypothetical protein